ncbi:MAG: hypothetical protein AAFX79_01130 [Planctomycetota bacterium]
MSERRAWLSRLRLRVAGVTLAIVVTAIAVASLLNFAVAPAIGVAAIAVAWVVNTMTTRLSQPVCYHCGADVGAQPSGDHGVICPECGGLSTPIMLARAEHPAEDADRRDA